MGFFDKVKNAVNRLTGGAAEVLLSFEGNRLSEPVKINITVQVKDSPVEIRKVYLRVRTMERIVIPRDELSDDPEQLPDFDLELEAFGMEEQEFVVEQAQVLEPNETYNWTYELDLSQIPNAKPSFIGKYARYEWEFFVGLDTQGNDPDSGWIAHEIVC